MSPLFPSKIFDLIVDHLHDERTTLNACCLVSKSWVPRTRRHLFSRVQFNAFESSIESWMEAFPDPLNSPAHYTHELSVSSDRAVNVARLNTLSWIRAFRGIESLVVETAKWDDSQVSLVPLHGLSPTLKSLTITHIQNSVPLSDVFGLVCSFPYLEDLTLVSTADDGSTDEWTIPPTSPNFTGSLCLWMKGGSLARRLLDLPGGLRFSDVSVVCLDEDAVKSTTDLVSGCHSTLEVLGITNFFPSTSETCASFDLSKATKLKDLGFWSGRPRVEWIVMALQTVESENLREIIINLDAPTSGHPLDGMDHQEWVDLDRLLLQFWNSHSIRPKVHYLKRHLNNYTPILFTELTIRGLLDVF